MKDIYIEIISKTAEFGGIDAVGVVSEPGHTAVCFSGTKVLEKYMGGGKKLSVLMQITCMDDNKNQLQLVSRLRDIGNKLEKTKPVIEGIYQPEYRISSQPVPTVHNEHFWIYSMTVEIIFYLRKD